MKKTAIACLIAVCLLCTLLASCGDDKKPETPKEQQTVFAVVTDDKDFSSLRTPGSQEEAYEYKNFFLPAVDGISQPYVGDTMPYYEDGTYYIYYLKEGGDSYNHSVYLTTTTDFLTYTEYDAPILESNRSGGQDGWTGTGSVVKVKNQYYFFYTAHASSDATEYGETLRLAKGDDPMHFEKVEGFEITPPSSLGQKRDFRDPQAYYNAETDSIILTVTASQSGVARILKYSMNADLSNISYDGIIFTDTVGNFWNLECSDTFKLGDKYYITYSAQDDTLWYASADEPYGPYGEAKILDGELFYAAKHVDGPDGPYMVGWARRSESPSSTSEVTGWAGNLAVQKLAQQEDGDLVLVPVGSIRDQFTKRRELKIKTDSQKVEAGARYSYVETFNAYESFMLTGKFSYTGSGDFGLAFDYNGQAGKYKLVTVSPAKQKLQLQFNEGDTLITETPAALEAGREYTFTYIQEGSVGIFYLDGEASLTVRLYGVSGKSVRLYAENNTVNFSDLREYTR